MGVAGVEWVEVTALPPLRRAAADRAGRRRAAARPARDRAARQRPEPARERAHRDRAEGRPVSRRRSTPAAASPARRTALSGLQPARAARARLPDRDARHVPAPDAAADRRLDTRRRTRTSARSSPLTTRAPDDPAIALLDAWAVVGDVLSFYQERIANEGFLRTATERRSVLELARQIGYELNPGVAAATYLVWEVEARFAVEGQTPPSMPPAAARGARRRRHQGAEHAGAGRAAADVRDRRRPRRPQRPQRAAPAAHRPAAGEPRIDACSTSRASPRGFVRGDRVTHHASRAPAAEVRTSVKRDEETRATGGTLPGVDVSLLEVTDVVPEPELESDAAGARGARASQPPPSQPPAADVQDSAAGRRRSSRPTPPPTPAGRAGRARARGHVLVPTPADGGGDPRPGARRSPGATPGCSHSSRSSAGTRSRSSTSSTGPRIGLDLGPVFDGSRWCRRATSRARPSSRSSRADKAEAARDTVVVVTFSEPMNAAVGETRSRSRAKERRDEPVADASTEVVRRGDRAASR